MLSRHLFTIEQSEIQKSELIEDGMQMFSFKQRKGFDSTLEPVTDLTKEFSKQIWLTCFSILQTNVILGVYINLSFINNESKPRWSLR